jgi:hypothetical protein
MEDAMMNDKNFITCSQCLRELIPTPTLEFEEGEAMISDYHCEQCCYSFSIYSITKTKLAEIKDYPVISDDDEIILLEQHEMEDK